MIIEFVKKHISGIEKGHICDVAKVSFAERMIKEKYAKLSDEESLKEYNDGKRLELEERAKLLDAPVIEAAEKLKKENELLEAKKLADDKTLQDLIDVEEKEKQAKDSRLKELNEMDIEDVENLVDSEKIDLGAEYIKQVIINDEPHLKYMKGALGKPQLIALIVNAESKKKEEE